MFDAFVPATELLPLAQAIGRVFARLGEKKNRSRARIKFLVQDLGIEKFKELVLEERKTLAHDPRWTEFVADAEQSQETALRPASEVASSVVAPEGFERWRATNTRAQKQGGYAVVTVALPLGDITADQLRALADIARRFTKETIRTTVEQNFVIRWVSQGDLPDVYRGAASRRIGRCRGQQPGRISLPARGRTRANWGSLLRADWPRNCAMIGSDRDFARTRP